MKLSSEINMALERILIWKKSLINDIIVVDILRIAINIPEIVWIIKLLYIFDIVNTTHQPI